MSKPICAECDTPIPLGDTIFEVREVEAEYNEVKPAEEAAPPVLLCSAVCMARYGIYLLEEIGRDEEE